MKRILSILSVVLCCSLAQAQDKPSINVQAEVRFDYQREYIDGNALDANSGFEGKFLNVMAFGRFNDRFSYAFRQRLNKAHTKQSVFDATDFVNLTYRLNSHWSFTAGKQLVDLGRMVYNKAPIDMYFCTEFWNKFALYQWGVNTNYTTGNKKDVFQFQLTESPYDFKNQDLYAFNLMWMGSHGWFKSFWSLNAMAYEPGEYLYFLSLGNHFQLGNAALKVDFMNRGSDADFFRLKDFSLIGELSYPVQANWNVYGKVSYDINKTENTSDFCVLPGTELTRVGAGMEYYPLKEGNKNLRFHLYGCYATGKNGNPSGSALPGQFLVAAGVKMRVNVFQSK